MLDAQIRKAHADRADVPALCRMLMGGHVVVIASWTDPDSRSIRLQDFVLDGRSFVPIFSDDAHFRRECAGSGFEDRGVSMDANLLASIIGDDLLLILNPASPTPVELRRADLLPHLRVGQ
jgi:hypothetical protein